ncbi:hypothetical protein KAJ27_23335 [bacterium]|nr:hypothetical protein [bacterium]
MKKKNKLIIIMMFFSYCSIMVHSETTSDLISVMHNNDDIRSVLKLIQVKTGMNMIVHSNVKGNISINIDSILPGKALKMICALYGYKYSVIDGVHMVGKTGGSSFSDYTEETKMFSVNHRSAESLASSLRGIIDHKKGRVTFDKRTNRLIVQAEPDVMKRISQLIDELDIEVPSIIIEAKLYSSQMEALREVGFIWEWDPIEISESTSHSVHGEFSTGLDFTKTGDFHRKPVKINGFFNARENAFKSKVLSTQSVMIENNSQGIINVGDKIIYGGGIDIPPQEKDTGIVLKVTPVIQGSNRVQVSIDLEVSSVTSYQDGYPVIAQQRTSSKNTIPFNIEVPIGGVTGDGESVNTRKVPFLGDTSVLDNFMKNNTKGKNGKCILITVKAKKVVP